MNGLLGHGAVLVTILAAQATILRRAHELYRQDDSSTLGELSLKCAADVEARARRGQGPDWLRYQADADELFDRRDDRLRSLAAAALAVGLGGTLFALFVSLLARVGEHLEPLALLGSLGLSLLGSLTGVIVNLVIVLVYLPAAEDKFNSQTRSFRRSLEEVGGQHPPQEAFTQTLRDELSQIRKSLNTEFASAFSTAITGFPQVVSDLGIHIDKLATVVEGEVRSIGGAASELARCGAVVAESGALLLPALGNLTEATGVLEHLPQALREVVDSSRNDWLTSLRSQHESSLKELSEFQRQVEQASQERERRALDSVRELQAAVAEVRDAVARIPEQLGNEVIRASKQLGSEFGREAWGHTSDLKVHLQAEYDKLLQRIEGHEQQWRNNIGSVVDELFARISGEIQAKLVTSLREVASDLDEVVRALPEAAAKLVAANVDWSQTHETSLEKWREVGALTLEAAGKLGQADGQLRLSTDALGASADHLEKVARITDDFEAALIKSHQDAVAGYIDKLDELREHLVEILQEVNSRQQRLDHALARQSDVISRCIQQVMRGRQLATLEGRV